MTTTIDGTLGVSLIQANTVDSSKIVDASIEAIDLAPGVGGGSGVPAGGAIGTVLTKASATDYDTSWVGAGVPVGGTTGQVLSKVSNTDYDLNWATPSGGSGGLGVGQTWQIVTGSRAYGVDYTNSTGGPIAVEVYGIAGIIYGQLAGYVGGVLLFIGTQAVIAGGTSVVSMIVPDGATYKVTTSTVGLSQWAELRP